MRRKNHKQKPTSAAKKKTLALILKADSAVRHSYLKQHKTHHNILLILKLQQAYYIYIQKGMTQYLMYNFIHKTKKNI